MSDVNLSSPGGKALRNSRFFILHLELEGIQPAIQRAVIVPKNANLGWLHAVIQIVMGWTNSHLHQFRVGDRIFSDPTFNLNEFDGDPPVTDEAKATVEEIAGTKTAAFLYDYDFGDSWTHFLAFEPLSSGHAAAERMAVCIEGSRACPPEDCGGVPGYENLLEALRDPRHPEHREMKQWLGRRYDPEGFSVSKANRFLPKLPWPNVSIPELAKVLKARDRARA